jgi:hypothetical protein
MRSPRPRVPDLPIGVADKMLAGRNDPQNGVMI